MSRIIKLTESDLNRIVKRVIVENKSKRYSDAILLLLETFKEDCVCGFEVDYIDETETYLIKMIVGIRDLDNKFPINIQIRNYINKLKKMVNDHVYNYLPIRFLVVVKETPRCKSSLSESKVDVLVDMIKEKGWGPTSNLVGGNNNLKKLSGIVEPIDFLNLFNDLNVDMNDNNTRGILTNNEGDRVISISFNSKGKVFASVDTSIWGPLSFNFLFNNAEVANLVRQWLKDVYGIKVFMSYQVTF